MRRLIALLATLLTSATLAVSFATPAQAVTPLTGRLVDAYNSSLPVAGTTVRLRRVVAGAPGAIVDTAVTASNGRFSLDPLADPAVTRYFVQVVAGRYQGGYVGTAPVGVKPTASEAVTWAPGAALGDVLTIAAFARGQVVNSRTLRLLRGVVVTARDILDQSIILSRDTTDANGRFELTGLRVEEIGLRFNGAPVGYETGYAGCSRQVVPTFGEACTFGTGRLGRFFLDHS